MLEETSKLSTFISSKVSKIAIYMILGSKVGKLTTSSMIVTVILENLTFSS